MAQQNSASAFVVPPRYILAYLVKRYWSKKPLVFALLVGTVGMRQVRRRQLRLRDVEHSQLLRRSTVSALPRPPESERAPDAKAAQGQAAKAGEVTAGEVAKVAAGDVAKASPVVEKKPEKKKPIRVDDVFFRRLRRLLPVLVPGWRSKESILLASQTAMLVARSLLSIHISELMGEGLVAVMQRSPWLFTKTLSDFLVSGLLASVANSSLKYMGNLMAAWFRENLTKDVHRRYMANDNYYRAGVLAVGEQRLDNLDQRIVSDLNNFTKTLADLYSRTFKPALDLILCTNTMARSLGIKGPLIMYSYFIFSQIGLRAVSPPLAKMVAQQQAIEGSFRRCHTRLLSHAEEVAFIQGARREEEILNAQMLHVSTFADNLSLQQLKQGVADQFVLKYLASCVGWPVIALPFIIYEQGGDPVVWVAQYRVADDLIRQASTACGDLLLIYKKLQILSGYTARVAELLEALEGMSMPPASPGRAAAGRSATALSAEGASIETPDGRLLVSGLNISLPRGQSLLVTGPNGAGKTSFFRTMAGLWSCKDGTVFGPPRDGEDGARREMLYLPQKPYLVAGSLRDQVIYPLTAESAAAGRQGGAAAVDGEVREALRLAGMERFAEEGLDRVHAEWDDILSGGEKQRMGWGRLFFHSPAFAALDEATSAINVQQEGPLYQAAVDKGITLLSIAHRPTVRQYHQQELNISGDGSGQWTLSTVE